MSSSHLVTRAGKLLVRRGSFCLLLLAITLGMPQAGHSQDDSALKIVRGMADYLANQKVISATFDADIEVVTTELQKIQFTSSGQVLLSRPNSFRVSRTGGYSDVELIFDGTTATVLGRHNNIFAQVKMPGTIDQLVDRLHNDLGVVMPGADLLLARVFDAMTEGAIEAKHIGQGVIDGVECNHLALRGADIDWQLWVETGARPIPRKYVITSKAVTGAPQYTLRIKSWRTDQVPGADAFAFKPPADAKSVEIGALQDIDEVPHGVVVGGQK